MPWSLFYECWALSQLFHSPLSLSSRISLVLHFLPLQWYHLYIWDCCYFSRQSWFQLMIHPAWDFILCTLHKSYISRMTIHSLVVLFPSFEPVSCSISSSYLLLLTCIQVSQETGNVIWYSNLFKNFPQFVVIHTVNDFSVDSKADVFLKLTNYKLP